MPMSIGKITADMIANDAVRVVNLSTSASEIWNTAKRVAKAWVNFNGSTGAINASFNVSSVTRNSAGDYTVTFTVPFSNTSYVAVLGAHGGAPGVAMAGGNSMANKAAGSFRLNTFAYNSGAIGDVGDVSAAFFSL